MKVVAICVLLTLVELLATALILAPRHVLRALRASLAGIARRARRAVTAGAGAGRTHPGRTEHARP